TIESMIKAGAFDSLGYARRALLAVHEEAVDATVAQKRKEDHGEFTFDLFALGGGDEDDSDAADGVAVPDLPEWAKKEKLAFEREMLGLYVSDHPLQGLDGVLAQHADVQITRVLDDDGPADGA
ncbi:DNA polymerase III subunit alpha, partial [Aquicoccus sp. SCR17]|nr:DNA polymerase III subunit alpha [Carideicomes alvinocaridis]